MAKKFSILSREDAIARIALIGKRGNALMNDIQSISVTAIGYANVHGDVTIAQDICTTLQTIGGVRFTAFVKYLEVYGNLAWDKDTKNFVYRKNDNAVCDPAELVAQLHATRWFDAIKQEQPTSVYDVEEMVRKMLTKLTNAAKRENVTIENEYLMEELAKLVGGDDESDAE
jgi:hypothetical protein